MISACVDRPLGRVSAVLHSVELGDTEAARLNSPQDMNPLLTMHGAVAMLTPPLR